MTRYIKTKLLLSLFIAAAINHHIPLYDMRYIKPDFSCEEDGICFIQTQKLSKDFIEKLNMKLKNKIPLGNQSSREILLVSTKNFNLHIYDIKNGKELFAHSNLPPLRAPVCFSPKRASIFPEKITESEGKFYLLVHCKLNNIYTTSHISFLYDIFNNTMETTYHNKENIFYVDPYFKYGREKKWDHKDYTAELKSFGNGCNEILIRYKKSLNQVKIAKPYHRINSLCVSRMTEGRYALIHYEKSHFNKQSLILYDINTGAAIQDKKRHKTIDFFEIDQYIKEKKPGLIHAMFSKKDNFLIIIFKNYFVFYDLKLMKITMKKKFTEYAMSIIVSEDEKQFGIATTNSIYIFNTPMDKSKNKERLQFLREKECILSIVNLWNEIK